MGLVVRVHYVCTRPLGFQQHVRAKRKCVTVPFHEMTETETCFWETCFRFHPCYSSISRKDGNGNVFPRNMFPFPSIFQAKKTATLDHPARISIRGMTKRETCFQETRFCFHQSLVNSEKNGPAKLGRANLPMAGRFARGQKKTNPTITISTIVLHSLRVGWRNHGIFKNY